MSRQDATDLLMGEREGGVFLVRDSATIQVRAMVNGDGESITLNPNEEDDNVDGVLDW